MDDPDIALAIAGGALLGLGQLLLDQPDRDDAQTADDVTRDVLRMFGVTAKRAERLTTQALPDLTSGNDAGVGRVATGSASRSRPGDFRISFRRNEIRRRRTARR